MYSTCLFCNGALGANDVVEHFPVGKRLAFDTAKGRLWVVCASCGRWNLTPLDERWEAIDECERQYRGTFVRVSTGNVGLAKLRSGLELVRIGEPLRPEFAAWRYGSRFFDRRRKAQLLAGAGVAATALASVAIGPTIAPALTLGAISIVVVPGITTVMGAIPMVGLLAARDYLRHDRVIAHFATGGRIVTVRAKHAPDAELRVDAGTGGATFDVPHDGGWAHFEGTTAIRNASILLAGANRLGASAVRVQAAVTRIEESGDASRYLADASHLGKTRGRIMSMLNQYRGLGALNLHSTERLALEMAMHEETERRALEGELTQLAAAWREAEEIAQIADNLLPPTIEELRVRHLERPS